MGLRNFGKGLLIRKFLEDIPMIGKALKWLTDPSAIGRKRTIAAIAAVVAGMLRGAESALRAACNAADFVGSVCSFQPGNIAAALEGIAQWLNAVVVPGADAVTIIMGLWGLWTARGKKAVVVAAMIVLALFSPAVGAQEPTPTPEPDSIRFSTGGTRFYTPGQGDETEMEGQLLGIVHVPGKLVAEGFGRYTRTQGTEAAAGGLDVKSFRSIIADLKLRRQVFSGWVRTWALCLAGVSWSRDKAFNPSDPNVWAVGCGAKLESVKGSFSSVIGHNGSVGGRAVFGQLTINQGERVRYVATYAIPFSAERFRTYPGAFTSGVQVDAWVKERQR